MKQLDLSPKATEIVDRAQQLLAAGGYNGFSYADISESVQISKASIHHHFPSKADLVQTVVRRYRDDSRKGMHAVEQQIADPLAQLRAYTGYWEECIRTGTAAICVCAMLASELPAIPAQVAEEVRGHFRDLAAWLASILAKGAASGVFRLQASAESEAAALMAAVHGGMLAARVQGDPEVFTMVMQRNLAVLVSKS